MSGPPAASTPAASAPSDAALPAPPPTRALACFRADRKGDWAATTYDARIDVLNVLREFILQHQEDIARVAARDSGKTRA